ncbi:MAG TPA: acyl carrier protein [Candidatus Rubrimentiphilum sp.]|nr:acyl carrier protein [Candidatus Rubrimentiphilum sp.]
MEVLDKIVAVVRDTFRVPEGALIDEQTTSADVEGWDSLSHAVLIMKVEEAFGLDLPLDRVYALNNLGELAQLLRDTGAAKEPHV